MMSPERAVTRAPAGPDGSREAIFLSNGARVSDSYGISQAVCFLRKGFW